MGTLAAAMACAQRAAAWLDSQRHLETDAPPATGHARRCHALRNRLAALQAALDVAAISAPGSQMEQEAHAVSARQCAAVCALLDDLREAAWAAR